MKSFRLVALTSVTLLAFTGCVKRNEAQIPNVATAVGDSFKVKAIIAGLSGTLVLKRGDDLLSISANGEAIFPIELIDGAKYQVSVESYPEGQVCSIPNPIGTVGPVTDVQVNCSDLNVGALHVSGANWNDYVKSDGSACAAPSSAGYGSCLHGGERRLLSFPAISSCADLSFSDSEGAFQWSCEESGGNIRVYSTGLAKDKSLSHLLNFAAPAFKAMTLSIKKDGKDFLKSKSSIWWGNALAVNNAGGTLSDAGKIYVLNQDPSGTYEITADKVAIAIKPNSKLKTVTCALTASIKAVGKHFLWLEGNINANICANGVYLEQSSFSVLKNLKVASSGQDGVFLKQSNSNLLDDVVIARSGMTGLRFDNSKANVISHLSSFNNSAMGIALDIDSGDNVFFSVFSTANSTRGVDLIDNAGNAFIELSTPNNGGEGMTLRGASYTTVMEMATANHLSAGVSAYANTLTSRGNQFINLASAHSSHGVNITGLNFQFKGLLKLGSNTINNCTVSGASAGLYNGTCSDSGAYGSSSYAGALSDAEYRPGLHLGSSFVGKVLTTDSVNDTNVLGFANGMTADSDWTRFETKARAWGFDGSPFPNVNHTGSGFPNCQVWDWSVLANDAGDRGPNGIIGGSDDEPALLGEVACPSQFIEHRWSVTTEAACLLINGASWHGGASYCTSEILANASELLGDGKGNENGLCEAGEGCFYTPNIGAYQGHGDLVSASKAVANTKSCADLSSITLKKFSINGK